MGSEAKSFSVGDKVVIYGGKYDDLVYEVIGHVIDKDEFVLLRDQNGRTFVENKESIDLARR